MPKSASQVAAYRYPVSRAAVSAAAASLHLLRWELPREWQANNVVNSGNRPQGPQRKVKFQVCHAASDARPERRTLSKK